MSWFAGPWSHPLELQPRILGNEGLAVAATDVAVLISQVASEVMDGIAVGLIHQQRVLYDTPAGLDGVRQTARLQ